MSKKDVLAIESAMGVFVSIISGLAKLVKELGGTMHHFRRLATPEGRESLKEIARVIFHGVVINDFVRLLYYKEDIIVKACDGTASLRDADDVFTTIDEKFNTLSAKAENTPTKKTRAKTYEIISIRRLVDVFNSFSVSWDKLYFTDDQIIDIVKNNKELFYVNRVLYFLFKSNNEFLVAFVQSDGPPSCFLTYYELDHDTALYDNAVGCIIVPKFV